MPFHEADHEATHPLRRPMVIAALTWIVGLLLGDAAPYRNLWLIAAMGSVAATLWMRRRRSQRGVRGWGLIALLTLSATWAIVHLHHVPVNSIRAHIGESAQLAQIQGEVITEPRFSGTDGGAMAQYGFRPPGVLAIIEVHSIWINDQPTTATGRLMMKINRVDPHLHQGDRIQAVGWLSAVKGPDNPGQYDYRVLAQRQEVDGRLTLAGRGNWRLIEHSSLATRLDHWRRAWSRSAQASLRLGLLNEQWTQQDQQRVAFLDAIVLGRRSNDTAMLHESFRKVGLAHLLSISGAHLAILLGLIWITARTVVSSPPRAAMVVLAVLAMYLFAVPWRTPIVRAGIMAALFAGSYALGRRTAAVELLSLAAIIVLLCKPGDLFSPGFQLSFTGVAGLIILTPGVNRHLLQWTHAPRDPPTKPPVNATRRFMRWLSIHLVRYVAANITAFVIVTPLVAHHFQIVTPLAVLVSLAALPLVTVVLGLSYLKIVLGLLLPSASMLLAWPLSWTSDALLAWVQSASATPGSSMLFVSAPSALWTLAATGLGATWLAGAFVGRKRSLAVAVSICAAWFWLQTSAQPTELWAQWRGSKPPLEWRMFSVGNGSCHLIRLQDGDGEFVLMYDCGSNAYFDVGQTSIAPALGVLGVKQIDLLVLSHANMDHYNGVLDVADSVEIDRVLISPIWLANVEAEQAAREKDETALESAASFVVSQLRQRDISVETAWAGWAKTVGDAKLKIIWPPVDFPPDTQNDRSIVLSIRAAGRRALLCGDIEQQAMDILLQNGAELSADICELPHHGSYHNRSTDFLDAIRPSVVMQSTGPTRLHHDLWAPYFENKTIKRFVSAHTGMMVVTIEKDGRITWRAFHSEGELSNRIR